MQQPKKPFEGGGSMNSERLQRLQEEGPSSSAYKKSPSKGLNKKFQEGSRERLERMNPSDPSAQPSLETPTTQQGGQQRKRKLGAPQQEPPEESVEEMEAKEGEFRLHQNKLRAGIRIKDGRGLPIDILIANYYFALDLLFGLDLEESALEMDPSDPWTLFSQLDPMQLSQIEVDLKAMAEIDSDPEGRDYWASLRALAGQEILAQKRLKAGLGKYEGVQASTAEDLDTLFGSKSYDELVTLDQQVTDKLQAGGPIDTEYWDAAQQCLRSWKAKTRVSQIYSRLQAQRKEHISSRKLKRKVDPIYIRFGLSVHALKEKQELSKERDAEALVDPVKYETYDPSMSPVLKAQLGPEDKGLDIMELETFMKNLDFAREKVQEAVADKKKERASKPHGSDSTANKKKKIDAEVVASPPPPVVESHKKSKAQEAEAAFLREAASGMGEGEEVFANEEQLLDASSALANANIEEKYRPRKPRYFNRILTGFEWNRYNRTCFLLASSHVKMEIAHKLTTERHYSAENPPPRMVQGYKFNMFYPDLIDKTKTPTFKIVKDEGFPDTVIIRFVAGAPYEDVAFRIVNREWEFSHRKGYRCDFDRGVLKLWIEFKREVYRR